MLCVGPQKNLGALLLTQIRKPMVNLDMEEMSKL